MCSAAAASSPWLLCGSSPAETRDGRPGSELRCKVVDISGLPRDNRSFWASASSRRYLHRLRMPLQVHHYGTSDAVCPIAWSRATVRTGAS